MRCQASPDEPSIVNKMAVALTAVSASWVSGWPGAGARGRPRGGLPAPWVPSFDSCMPQPLMDLQLK